MMDAYGAVSASPFCWKSPTTTDSNMIATSGPAIRYTFDFGVKTARIPTRPKSAPDAPTP